MTSSSLLQTFALNDIATNPATVCSLNYYAQSALNFVLSNTGAAPAVFGALNPSGDPLSTPNRLPTGESRTVLLQAANTLDAYSISGASTLTAFPLLPQNFTVTGITQIGVNMYGALKAPLQITNSGSNPCWLNFQNVPSNGQLLAPGASVTINYTVGGPFMVQTLLGQSTTLQIIVQPS